MTLQNPGKKESFGYVLKRHMALIIALVLLLAAVGGTGLALRINKDNNENLNLKTPPVDLGLKPIDFLDEDAAEGNLGTVLTETTPQGIEYFSDALFIGDSLTDGIRIYLSSYGIQAVSTKGVNTHSALTDAFHQVGDHKLTMIDAIEYYKPRKVYMMLGTNGLGFASVDWNLEGYEVLVDEILRRVPGCYVIVQSIPPTTESMAISRPSYSRENIMRYNEGLRDIAMRKGVYFLDVNSALSNPAGYLDPSIAAGDGYHMQPAGYQIWYDYIITHAVLGESAYNINPDGLLDFVAPGSGSDDETTAGTGETADGADSAAGDEAQTGEPPDDTGT